MVSHSSTEYTLMHPAPGSAAYTASQPPSPWFVACSVDNKALARMPLNSDNTGNGWKQAIWEA